MRTVIEVTVTFEVTLTFGVTLTVFVENDAPVSHGRQLSPADGRFCHEILMILTYVTPDPDSDNVLGLAAFAST